MASYVEVSVSGFEEFNRAVAEHPGKTIFAYFSGSKDAGGKSWCPDCVQGEASTWTTTERGRLGPERGRRGSRAGTRGAGAPRSSGRWSSVKSVLPATIRPSRPRNPAKTSHFPKAGSYKMSWSPSGQEIFTLSIVLGMYGASQDLDLVFPFKEALRPEERT